jgi:uncharacterized protein (DUF1919 family)
MTPFAIIGAATKFTTRVRGFLIKKQKERLGRRFHRTFGTTSHCYISQNCIGGRFYDLQKRAYTAPTVGLWFEPADFLKFCANLRENLHAELLPDRAESTRLGYPVGRVNDIKVLFQHYATFEEAKAAWQRRAARVSFDDIFILMTDRDGFTEADLAGFEKLATNRKILFSHRAMPHNENVVHIPGFENDGCVGELYGSYHNFNRRRVRRRLFDLLGRAG